MATETTTTIHGIKVTTDDGSVALTLPGGGKLRASVSRCSATGNVPKQAWQMWLQTFRAMSEGRDTRTPHEVAQAFAAALPLLVPDCLAPAAPAAVVKVGSKIALTRAVGIFPTGSEAVVTRLVRGGKTTVARMSDGRLYKLLLTSIRVIGA